MSSTAFVLSLLLFAQTSVAQTGANTKRTKVDRDKSTEEAVKTAKKACSRGDYEKGIAILADLYVEKDEPVHVFNQGRCYQQNNRFEEAVARFREFERLRPQMSAVEKATLDKNLAECERELAKRAGRTTSPTAVPSAAPAQPAALPPASTPTQPSVVPPASVETTTVAEKASSPEIAPASGPSSPTAESGHGSRVAGITTGLAGLALIGAGVAFNIAANNADAKVRDGDADKVSTRNRYETLGWVGYGVGAAALATGTALFVLSYRSEAADRPALSLLPTFGQGRASLVFEGVF